MGAAVTKAPLSAPVSQKPARMARWRDSADQAAGSPRMADQADNARESDGLGAGDKVFPPNLGVQMLGSVRVIGIN